MCKIFRNKKADLNDTNIVDTDMQEYREHFKIRDKYLIEYQLEDVSAKESSDKKIGYIVYIDYQNDCDWKDERDPHKTFEGDKYRKFIKAICDLNVAHAMPCNNLSEDEVLIFKKMIGSGYASALNGEFEHIDALIEKAKEYLLLRNKECARKYFLKSSGITAIAVICFWLVSYFWLQPSCQDWITGICMGTLGSFVSIWTRYGRMELTGLSSKHLHYIEAISRMFVGSIFAVVVLCGICCHIVFPEIDANHHLSLFALAGFLAGFSERFVPSLMEKLSHINNDKDE